MSLVLSAPRLTAAEATHLARDLYGVRGTVRQLPSERDQNFLIKTDPGKGFVLKIANARERPDALEAQNLAMEHVAREIPAIRCPSVCPTTLGETITGVDDSSGTSHFVRLLTFVPGRMMSEIESHSPDLLRSIGRFMATLDRALAGFSHSGARRKLHWDLARADTVVRNYLPDVRDPAQRSIIDRILLQFKADVIPEMHELGRSVIHNDGNDNNLVIGDGPPGAETVVGIIDFGDMVESHTIFDVAVATAYALLNKPDPLTTMTQVVAGYHETQQICELECDLLYDLIMMRLCLSVAISAHQRSKQPENPYLSVSENAAWATLSQLIQLKQSDVRARFRRACGKPTVAHSEGDRTPQQIVAARRRLIGPSLSIAYDYPLKIVRGSMQYLFDHSGRAYLDAVNNVCHVGHCHPIVVDAAQRQLALLNTNTRYLHDTLVEYAEKLVSKLPEPLRVCYFVCSGSEANDLALRLAHTHTKGHDLIVVEGAYHGNTSALIDVSPYKFNGPGGGGLPSHVHKVMTPDIYRGLYRELTDAGARYAQHVHQAVEEIMDVHQPVSAFICESLMGCAGQVVLPPGYLAAAFEHVRRAGGVCIADEVQVGFGRVGSHFWGFETQDVVPDIVTLGKPMGNGHPLAAVVTTLEIARSFDNGMEYFNTFGGNPVSCAVGLAVLHIIETEHLQENALSVGTYLKGALRSLMREHQLIGDVRGEGLFLGVELVRDRDDRTPATSETSRIVEHMKESGVLTAADGAFRNVLKIKPPLIFTAADADIFVSALDRALSAEARRAGYLPPSN